MHHTRRDIEADRLGVAEGIRVAIDAEILPWRNGGVAHALCALLHALAELPDGDESYRLVVGSEEEANFWRPEIGRNQTLVMRGEQGRTYAGSRRQTLQRLAAGAKAALRPSLNRLRKRLTARYWPEVPISDGFYESLGCDVLHLTWQRFILCAVPTVYNPHDLQHLHLPQLWPPEQLAWRETVYSTGCRVAQTVIVGSQWARDYIVRQYRVDPEKVQVIPEGPIGQLISSSTRRSMQEVREQYRLPEGYLLYPATMWHHKNHLRLLEALALLRDKSGLVVPLVCTGTQLKQAWPGIESRIRELGLESQVRCLGFVPEADLRVIQRSAHCLVQPSLFEASSLPIFDAWFDGVPVACSRATALPEQVGDAGLLFDPLSTQDIAEAIGMIVTRADLRDTLRDRGYRRVKDFDWSRTAKAYRAVYRRTAGLTLSEEDRWLLQWDWMGEPQKPCPAGTLHA